MMAPSEHKLLRFREHEILDKESAGGDDILQMLGKEAADDLERDSHATKGNGSNRPPAPKHLGIHASDGALRADYYIGVAWLKEHEVAAVVEPKIDGVDYIRLFTSALAVRSAHEAGYFSHYFGIDFDSPQIEVQSPVVSYLTPLLVIQYIALLDGLTQRGLKKGYLYREENLNSKVKGRVVVQKNLRVNQIHGRADRMFCAFNEYTVDIPENRLLKKALLFAEKALTLLPEKFREKSVFEKIRQKVNGIKPHFESVSDIIEVREVRRVAGNKLFKGYREAVGIAKMILRRYDYSYQNITGQTNRTFPFWIDMPRLYEMYVYSTLKKEYPDELKFQVDGYRGTAVDFILKDKKVILDAKYKPKYENGQRGIIDDIREISGYARDEKILKNFGKIGDTEEIDCVIVYPGKSDFEAILHEDDKEQNADKTNDCMSLNDLPEKGRKIKGFRNFFLVEINLPEITEVTS